MSFTGTGCDHCGGTGQVPLNELTALPCNHCGGLSKFAKQMNALNPAEARALGTGESQCTSVTHHTGCECWEREGKAAREALRAEVDRLAKEADTMTELVATLGSKLRRFRGWRVRFAERLCDGTWLDRKWNAVSRESALAECRYLRERSESFRRVHLVRVFAKERV